MLIKQSSITAGLSGPQMLYQGVALLWHPQIRWLVLIPLCINILLFSSLTWLAGQWLGDWLQTIMTQVPDWLHWLIWIVWLLFIVLALIIYSFGFTLLANLIGSPFYGLLAERILLMESDNSNSRPTTALMQTAWQSFLRQLQLLGYFVPRTIGVGLLTMIISFIPAINLLAPLIAGAWAAWSLSIQYLDYGAEIDQVTLRDLLKRGRQQRWRGMSFGFTVLIASAIPLLNVLILPAAVIGGTLLWSREYRPRP